jgi:DNA (cytosine-5)-methyltransferase 1
VKVGSLCSGYGGLDMGLALGLGRPLRHAWHVENDAAPSKILDYRYPGVPNYGDLKTLDYALMEPVDILTAGYPCQPFSDAGLRKGADDPRHLWPYVADAVRALRPRHVLLENVRGHVRRGLDVVIADLAALGYDARWGVVRASRVGAPHRRERIFIVAQDADSAARGERWLPAPGQAPGGRSRADAGGRGGAPAADADGQSAGRDGGGVPRAAQEDRRAHLNLPAPGAPRAAATDAASDGRVERRSEPARLVGRPDAAIGGRTASPHADREGLEGREPAGGYDLPAGRTQAVADAYRGRLPEQQKLNGEPNGPDASPFGADPLGRVLDWSVYAPAVARWEHVTGRRAPWATEPRGRGGAERLSPRFVEWMMGLPAGWVTDVPGLTANEQLKALGNGVVPQQAALAVQTLLSVDADVAVAA